jgi:hypothetical protein
MMKKKNFSMLMAALFASICLSVFPQRVLAENSAVWNMVTNTGQQISLKYVSYLLMADDNQSFTVVNTAGKTLDGVRTITFEKGVDTGVGSVGAQQLTLFPNPVTSTLTLTGIAAGQKVTIISMSGSKVITAITTDGQTSIDVSSLASGTYMLHAAGTTVKFIKK